MGTKSRSGAKPRIQKRNKRADAKNKIKKQSNPHHLEDHALWQGDKTANQNFKEIGLVMNNRPSLRHTKVGKALMGKARVAMNKRHYEKHGILKADEADFAAIEAAEAAKPKEKKDLT